MSKKLKLHRIDAALGKPTEWRMADGRVYIVERTVNGKRYTLKGESNVKNPNGAVIHHALRPSPKQQQIAMPMSSYVYAASSPVEHTLETGPVESMPVAVFFNGRNPDVKLSEIK